MCSKRKVAIKCVIVCTLQEEREVLVSKIMLGYYIHLWGLYVTAILQNSFPGLGDFFVLISVFGDPRYVYSIYFPLLYGFHPKLAVKVLHGGALGEWINLVMKWLFRGERPYWWVYENNLHHELELHQFHNTCETGPGTPSGHVTIMGIVWYIICDFLANKAQEKKKSNFVFLVWCLYAIVMVLVAISRVYIAAHFVHQCIGGLICGVMLGKFISKVSLDNIPMSNYTMFASFMFSTVWLIQLFLHGLGVNVEWTVELAHKWCADPKWIHVATSLYFTCWRFTASFVGLGILTNYEFYKNFSKSPQSRPIVRLFLAIAGTLAAYFCTYMLLESSEIIYLVYLSAFVMYVAMPVVVGIIVPYGLMNVLDMFAITQGSIVH